MIGAKEVGVYICTKLIAKQEKKNSFRHVRRLESSFPNTVVGFIQNFKYVLGEQSLMHQRAK